MRIEPPKNAGAEVYLTHTDGRNAFWQAWVEYRANPTEKSFVAFVRHGRIGSKGTSVEPKYFHSSNLAENFIESKVAEKLGKGYERIDTAGPTLKKTATPVKTKGTSKAQRVIEKAKSLGRHLHCPYCDARTVAPVMGVEAFDCTRCSARWNTAGEEQNGPQIAVAKPTEKLDDPLVGNSERFIDLGD